MAKTEISNTDLLWIFREKLSSFDERFKVAPIAIVPSGRNESGWSVVMNAGQRLRHPLCVKRIEKEDRETVAPNLCSGGAGA